MLIDDLNLMPKDDILEEQLAMLIEENKKQLVITSTVSPNSLEVSSKLQKRLKWGLTTSMFSETQ
nr:DnaA/Hda family protein [Streptococcus uberis]